MREQSLAGCHVFCSGDFLEGRESRANRMADQGLFQSNQHSQTLLAKRREIAADASKRLSSSSRAETAGDPLLDFDHPVIALGEAILGGRSVLLLVSWPYCTWFWLARQVL